MAGGQLRVLVIDDHPMLVSGLVDLLGATDDIRVTGTAHTGADGMQQCFEHAFDVALVDFRLPDVTGLELCRQLNDRWPDMQLIIFSADAKEITLPMLAQAKAQRVISKAAPGPEIAAAIRSVATREAAPAVGPDARVTNRSELTSRELDVLRLVSKGHTNREIGDQLGLSLETVKTHLTKICTKLGASNRANAVSVAQALGLL
jgi:two-component system nitrate/nitrite response regulator NarL